MRTLRPASVCRAAWSAFRSMDSGSDARSRPYNTAGTRPASLTRLTAFFPISGRGSATRLIRSIGPTLLHGVLDPRPVIIALTPVRHNRLKAIYERAMTAITGADAAPRRYRTGAAPPIDANTM